MTSRKETPVLIRHPEHPTSCFLISLTACRTSYDDGGPNLELCVQAQNYYAKHSFPTRVKAAGLLTAMEAKKLAGLDAMTIAPDLLHTLVETEEDKADVVGTSLVMNKSMAEIGLDRKYYIDDEQGYRKAFAKGYDGKGSWKTDEVSDCPPRCC